jgi:hypothetical protein
MVLCTIQASDKAELLQSELPSADLIVKRFPQVAKLSSLSNVSRMQRKKTELEAFISMQKHA